MAYFNNPRTEEELNNQFRQLLIKNNYRDPKNQKLVAAIRKEYDERLLQIKRANGYQTTGDKVISFIEKANAKAQAYAEEMEREQLREKQRIAQLKSKRYTKQELSDLLDEEKRYIVQIIQSAVRSEDVVYLSLKSKSTANDYVMLYQFFVSNSILLQDTVPVERFNAVREEIEYATDFLSQNKHQYDNVMTQVEITMGKLIAQSIVKYEEMYVDPIKIQETDSRYRRTGIDKTVPRTMNGIIKMFLTVPAWVLLVVFAIMGVSMADSNMFMVCWMLLIYLGIIELFDRLIVRPLEKKKNRVRTHKQAKDTGKAMGGVGHLISSLIKLFLG